MESCRKLPLTDSSRIKRCELNETLVSHLCMVHDIFCIHGGDTHFGVWVGDVSGIHPIWFLCSVNPGSEIPPIDCAVCASFCTIASRIVFSLFFSSDIHTSKRLQLRGNCCEASEQINEISKRSQ